MSGLVKDVALTPIDHSETDALIRAATDPNMDMAKLSALIDMRERVMKIQAKASFDRAFTDLQQELPVVVEYKKTNNSSYAPLEDIVEVVRPILAKHGFGLSHRTEWLDGGRIRIVGVLAHRDGHERESTFETPPDDGPGRNKVQAVGSAMTYGRRYTTNDLLNIVTRSEDDDAKRTGRMAPPEGYDAWLSTLMEKAEEGLPALQQMWAVATKSEDLKPYANYLTKAQPDTWNALKVKASKIKGVTK